MDDSMVITLFRHGVTEENKRKVYLGWTDSPLCLKEKEKLNHYQLSDQLVFASDLGRCIETAKVLFPHQISECYSEFREMNFGEWEGLTYKELANNMEYRRWINDFHSNKPPRGEYYQDFAQRIDQGWEKIIDRIRILKKERAILITHGGVIRHLLSRFAPEQKEFWDWNVPHGKGVELVWQNDGWRRGDRCTLLQEVPLTENPIG